MLWELQEIYESILKESVGKTLYHGTCKSKFEQSPKNSYIFGGGDGDDSSLVNNFHDISEYIDDEDWVDERETPVFAADKTTFDKAVSAMTWCLASKKDKDFPSQRDVTWNDIRNDGIIFVFYDTDTEDDWRQYSAHARMAGEYDEEYKGLEDEDYFKSDMVKPDGWWEGSKLVSILKRKGHAFK